MSDHRDRALVEIPVVDPYQDLAELPPPPPTLTADLLPDPGPARTEINRRVGQGVGQLMLLGIGIMLLVFGGLTLSQTGSNLGRKRPIPRWRDSTTRP